MFIGNIILEWIQTVLIMAGYVGSSAAFPEQLSADEEKKYIELTLNGDINAKNMLIEHNLRLVAHIAKKYSDEKNSEDLISVGTIGLIKGVNTYNPKKAKKLSTYIAKCVENEILMHLRSGKKYANEISLEETIGTDKEGNNMTFSDILTNDDPDFSDIVFKKLEAKKLYYAIDHALNPNEAMIICQRYGLKNTKKKTQREIAKNMGISRSYISRIEKKCLMKLANFLSENNI